MSVGRKLRRDGAVSGTVRAVVAALCLLGGVACSADGTGSSVRIQLLTRDDQGRSLPDVPIAIDGTQVAMSNADGRVSTTLAARGRARVAAACPEGYRSPEPRTIPLGTRDGPSALELELICKPELRSLLVVVRTQRAGAASPSGFTLSANGEPLGVVGEDGTLHVLLQRAPDTELRLMLDTSEHPQMTPRNPVRELKVMDRDEIVVFDQLFAVEMPRQPPRSTASPKGKGPTKHIPYAIGARSQY